MPTKRSSDALDKKAYDDKRTLWEALREETVFILSEEISKRKIKIDKID